MVEAKKFPLPTCCEDGARLDFSKVSFPEITIHWWDPTLWKCVFYILLCPIFWILVAHLEYRRRWLSWLCCGATYLSCTLTACVAIGLALLRNWSFRDVLYTQPKWPGLQENWILWLGHCLFLLGFLLILTSFLSMGFYGTYFGVYFGLQLPFRVYRFPYSLMDHPMYWGATMIFTGMALFSANQTALLLAMLIGLCYWITVLFESPIIEAIHSNMRVCQATQTILDEEEPAIEEKTLPKNTVKPTETSPSRKGKKAKRKSKEGLESQSQIVEEIGQKPSSENKKDV